jgi:hypothetical protein
MSIIRFGEQDSDVYVYLSDEGWECCGCCFVTEGFRAAPRTRDEMMRHLELHRLTGDVVPEVAFLRLVIESASSHG